MAFTGITATEAQIDQKTGAGVDGAYTDTMKTQMLLQAESYINAVSRFNWSDWYVIATINPDFKYIITEVTASLVAVEAIKYNMNATYTSRQEAEDMINILNRRIREIVLLLKDATTVTFIKQQI